MVKHISSIETSVREASTFSSKFLCLACLSSTANPHDEGGAGYPDYYAKRGSRPWTFCRLQTVWSKWGWFESEKVAGESWVKGCPVCSSARPTLQIWRIWDRLWLESKEQGKPLCISSCSFPLASKMLFLPNSIGSCYWFIRRQHWIWRIFCLLHVPVCIICLITTESAFSYARQWWRYPQQYISSFNVHP